MTLKRILVTGVLVCLFSSCVAQTEQETLTEPATVAVDRTTEALTTEQPTETTAPEETPTIAETTTEPETEPIAEAVDYEALGVNEMGHIMVVMYHGIKDNPPYHRTKENFLKDLQFMFDHGYRLVSMSDYINGTIDVPAGTTPIVLTFDDGLPTTFSFVETEDGFAVNPDSAIGLLESFAEENPEFGTDASLFIHGSDWNFRGAGTGIQRMEWLVENGYEIGNHTNGHENLKQLDGDGIVRTLGKVEKYVDSVLPGYDLFALTYTYGARPAETYLPLLNGGVYEDYELNYMVAFREGPSAKFYPPTHEKFQPLNAPRVRGSEGEVQDLWWFFDYYETHPELKYVSDGDPATIVVDEEGASFVSEAARSRFEVIIY